MKMNETKAPVKVGLVGLGRAGQGIHYPAFRNHPDFVITAVHDPDGARMAQLQGDTGCRTFTSIEELVGSGSCQLVVIATPSHFHFRDAMTVLEGGLACVLEKPMATEWEEAQTLVDYAREKGLHLFVHHQHLFNDEYNYFKEILEHGILGELFQIRAFWGGFNRRWDWQTLKKNGGGQLNNTCPHVISVVLPLLGEPVTSVSASLRNVKDAGDAEDHVQILLETESGITADIVVTSACAQPVPMWMLLGSNGTLSSAEGLTAQIKYFDPAEAGDINAIDAAAPLDVPMSETLPWQEIEEPVRPGKASSTFVDNVADVLLRGGEMVVTPESALEVMRVLDLCRAASEKRLVTSSI